MFAFEESAATPDEPSAAPTVAVAPAATVPAPAAARLRVVIHYNASRQAAKAAARWIAGGTFGAVELRRVGFAIRRPELRVFHRTDAARAADLAAAASTDGARPTVRDFGHFRSLPAPGLIEMWVR